MLILTEKKILNDIEIMKNKGYYERLKKLYKRLPVTSCNCCGDCCKDSPVLTYVEFLYAYNYLISNKEFTKETKVDIYKNAIREFMIGLISSDKYCPFMSKDKKCIIHEVSPLACKRWGIQSEETFLRDINTDHERNKGYQEYYDKLGIHIPDEVINRVTRYCNDVKIINNPYNIVGRDFDKFYSKDLKSMILEFSDMEKQANDWSIGTFLVYNLLGRRAHEDRIKVVKEYQGGDTEAVEKYLNLLKIEDLIK